jgi:hypothetical protein
MASFIKANDGVTRTGRAHFIYETQVSPPGSCRAVLNRTLSFPQTQTCFACAQDKSPGLSTVAGDEEMLVAGGLIELTRSFLGDAAVLEAGAPQRRTWSASVNSQSTSRCKLMSAHAKCKSHEKPAIRVRVSSLHASRKSPNSCAARWSAQVARRAIPRQIRCSSLDLRANPVK